MKPQIIIPLGGKGERFAEYNLPKPVVPVEGKPMLYWAVKSLPDGEYTFIYRPEHKCTLLPAIHDICLELARPYQLVELKEQTRGAAETLLQAEEFVDGDQPLLIANCDQYIETDWYAMQAQQKVYDGLILTFKVDWADPKWSYVAHNSTGLISRVAEKQPISEWATCGIYWWVKAGDFFLAAKAMIEANYRVNGEFYTAPTYNFAIARGLKVVSWPVKRMVGLGTPEDVRAFEGKGVLVG